MNEHKLEVMLQNIRYFVADHNNKNRHPLTEKQIIKHFSVLYKKRHIREILKVI